MMMMTWGNDGERTNFYSYEPKRNEFQRSPADVLSGREGFRFVAQILTGHVFHFRKQLGGISDIQDI